MDGSLCRTSLETLDAWVLEELDAINRARAEKPERDERPPAENRQPPDEDPAGPPLFDSEEESFIARTVAWLGERPNADMLLEEVWRQAVREAPEDSDDPEGPAVDEADDESDDDLAASVAPPRRAAPSSPPPPAPSPPAEPHAG